MKTSLRLGLLFLSVLATVCVAGATQKSDTQAAVPTYQTVLVLPFDNTSKAPGIEWIGEAFPEVLGQRLSVPGLYVISRDDRNYAFDRMGIPTTVRPSRATLYRIAEQMDADFVILGDYNFDGQTFTARAQVLDMKRLRLSPTMESAGPLLNLISIENSLAYELLKNIHPQQQTTKEEFMAAAKPVRLDAFENYIRGLVATDRTDKVRRLKAAVKLDPQYTLAMLHLGRTYYKDHDYETASLWLSKIPSSDASAAEANFLLGLSQYYLGNYDKAEAALKTTMDKVPLTEVVNDVGVVMFRQGESGATQYFERAEQADPLDPAYAFNYSLALWRDGDTATATKILRESVQRHPTDVEAKQLLDQIISGASVGLSKGKSAAAQAASDFLPRIKKNYDETSYRQLALELQNVMEQAASKTDPKRHASLLVEQGQQLLGTGMVSDAERDFREAVVADPTNADGHAGLAKVAELKKDEATARSEAGAALQLHPSVDAYMVLARLDAKANNLSKAMQRVDQALWLEPNNADALALKHELQSRQKPQ